ncbi:hypothetical protein DESPIG_02322 [Desulfovibrio piger ATCC 29098]|uniref:Uncharacterized protein n=1 Tax=Desulfovibrio piger ATCC 29098 TaxID=411464 RepID=B6WW54_9BACT|nr:hypothetical protein DESPIG_02322 [Desulfovibrio piger ATCC 29098]
MDRPLTGERSHDAGRDADRKAGGWATFFPSLPVVSSCPFFPETPPWSCSPYERFLGEGRGPGEGRGLFSAGKSPLPSPATCWLPLLPPSGPLSTRQGIFGMLWTILSRRQRRNTCQICGPG